MKTNKFGSKSLLAGLVFSAVAAVSFTARADYQAVDSDNFESYTVDSTPAHPHAVNAKWGQGADDESAVVVTNVMQGSQALLVDTVTSETSFTPAATTATHLTLKMEMVASDSDPDVIQDSKLVLYYDGEHVKAVLNGGTLTNTLNNTSVIAGQTYDVDITFTPTTTIIKVGTNQEETLEASNSSATITSVAFKGYGLVDDIVLNYPKIELNPILTVTPNSSVAGNPLNFTVTVTDASGATVPAENYTITTNINTSVASTEYSVTATAKDDCDYTGTATAQYTVTAAAASDGTTNYASLSAAIAGTTSGGTVTLSATSSDNITLSDSKSLTLNLNNNTLTGSATVNEGSTLTITGAGIISGNIYPASGVTIASGYYATTADEGATYTVAAKTDLSDAVIAPIANQTYTGSAIEPALAVTLNETTLTLGTDYTVAYANNTDVGTATATITGTDAYMGTKTATFEITAATSTITLSESTGTVVAGSTTTFTVTATGDGTVSVASSAAGVATAVLNGTTVTVTGVAAGTATITVSQAAGTNYGAATDATYTITVEAAEEPGTSWWDNDFSETTIITDPTAFKTNGAGQVEANFGGTFALGTGDTSSVAEGKLNIATDTETTDTLEKRLKWKPVDPEARLSTNIVELTTTLSAVETLPDITNDDYQFALANTNGYLIVWDGEKWTETNIPAPGGETTFKFLFDYSNLGARTVSIYFGTAFQSTISLTKPALGINEVHFSGSGTVDDFKATLKGEAPVIPAVAPGTDEGSFDEAMARTLADLAEVEVPTAVSEYVSDPAAYKALFKVVAVPNAAGTSWTLEALLNETGTNTVTNTYATVATAVQANLGLLATSGEAKQVTISNLVPGIYYAVGTATELTGSEYTVGENGWHIADGSNEKNGEITLTIPAPGNGETKKFYVIKVKTAAN